MKFCPDHWQALRDAIDTRGLTALIADSGEQAVANMASELDHGPTVDNFDPLMGAHNSIMVNAMELAREIGVDPLVLMFENPAHPEWECPICYLNWLSAEHDRLCDLGPPECLKVRGQTFDDWIDQAADGALNAWQEMRA